MGDVHRARARTAAVAAQLAPSAPTPAWDAAVADLKATFPASQLSLDLKTRNQHGQSFGSLLPPAPPAAIVHALSTEDVVQVVRICSRRGIVLIPTGGRTALEGQFQATCCNPPPEERWNGPAGSDEEGHVEQKKRATASSRPTVHVSLSRMQDIRLYEQDFQAVVQPGVGWKSLNEHLAARGIKLFFPVSAHEPLPQTRTNRPRLPQVDPAPGSEFGGMAGVAGSGTNAGALSVSAKSSSATADLCNLRRT
jgi:D-lactate dehydrogenase (cytochrome)